MDDDISFQLTSPAFADGDTVPDMYTCKGQAISPPLEIHDAPNGTASFVLIMHDPDAPHGDFLHWTVWNFNPDTKTIAEGWLPDDVSQGANDAGQSKYFPPCPPSGKHRYIFELYALDSMLDLVDGAPEEDVRQAVSDHAISKTTLMGTVSKNGHAA